MAQMTENTPPCKLMSSHPISRTRTAGGRGNPAPGAISVSVAVAIESDLSTKHVIYDSEVQNHEDHAKCPPPQSHLKRVRPGKSILDGEIAPRIEARGQKTGIHGNRCAHHHGGKIRARGDKGFPVLLRPAETDYPAHCQKHRQRNREQDRVGTVVCKCIRSRLD